MRRETAVTVGARTQTLIIGNRCEPEDLDPHVVFIPTDARIVTALLEGLTRLDEATSEPRPAAAERWDISSDGLVYTFHLRADMRWSNGDPVTAADFVFSFQRMLTPAIAARYSYLLHAIDNAAAFNAGTIDDFSLVGAHAIDDRTLRIDLARPTPYLLSLAANWTWLPLHRATLEKFDAINQRGTKWTRAGNFVGNGPFVLAEWAPQSRVVVTKNPHYWNAARIRLNRIEFLPLESPDTEERNFRAGQQHVTWDMPIAKVAAYRAQIPSPLQIEPVPGTFYVNFNVARLPFDDVRVRRALGLAIDREAISRAVSLGIRPPATSFTPPNCGGYTARARLRHDCEAARRLLAEAGFPGGTGFPVTSLMVATINLYPQMGEAIQAMWQRELGVKTRIELIELTTLRQIQADKRHAMAIWGWPADYPDPMAMLELFITNAGNNRTNWSNPDYDRLLESAAKMANPQERFEILQQAEALLLEDAPVIPFGHWSRVYLVHPSVKGWAQSAMMMPRYANISLGN
jgi:oligopeptide transport system substrate-binding protein